MNKQENINRNELADFNSKYADEFDDCQTDDDGKRALTITTIPCEVTSRIAFLKTLKMNTVGYKLSTDKYGQAVLDLVVENCSVPQTYKGNFAVKCFIESLKTLNIPEVA